MYISQKSKESKTSKSTTKNSESSGLVYKYRATCINGKTFIVEYSCNHTFLYCSIAEQHVHCLFIHKYSGSCFTNTLALTQLAALPGCYPNLAHSEKILSPSFSSVTVSSGLTNMTLAMIAYGVSTDYYQ